MYVNLVGNKIEGKGLASDARVLRSFLEPMGFHVSDVQWNAPDAPPTDLNIFLEVYSPHLFRRARWNVLIPNVEWWTAQHGKVKYDHIWTKTRHATKILEKYGAQYIGFTTSDVKTDSARERRFLHVAGGSRFRNTEQIVKAWRSYYRKGQPEITIIALQIVRDFHKLQTNLPGLRWLSRIEDESEYRELFNSHLFHLQPSGYEGYGVALNECLSAGNVLITANAPPMNEIPALIHMPVHSTYKANAASLIQWARVTPEHVWRAVKKAWRTSNDKLKENQANARTTWETKDRRFRERLQAAIESLTQAEAA